VTYFNTAINTIIFGTFDLIILFAQHDMYCSMKLPNLYCISMVYFSVSDLGAGSDYAGFIGIAGVPSLDVRYTHNFSIIDYPLYHSVYETFHLVENYLDNNFKASHVVTSLVS